LAQRIGRKADGLFGGSIASVAVGLEIMRLRKALAAGVLSTEPAAAIAEFLRTLARDLVVRSSKTADAAVERIRSRAVAIAGQNTAETLQAAAALRIIAVAIEDYPNFFRRT
jgi:hypothetical protein